MSKLQLATVLGAMRLIADGSLNGDFHSLGVGESEYKLLTQDKPWTGQDRSAVRATLDVMIHGMMDIIGVPRFQPPAEYIAAVLASFVSPTNIFMACRWAEGGSLTEELASGAVRDTTPVTARELFALVVMVEAGGVSAKHNFEKKAGFAIAQSSESEPDAQTKKKRA